MRKAAAFGLAKLSISFVLIGYLFTVIDLQYLMERFSRTKLPFLVIAYSLLLIQTALSALKWRLILSADEATLPYLFLLRTYLVGSFISLFLPSSIGGDVYRVIALKSRHGSLGKSTSSVIFDRLTGLFALLTIALVAYTLLLEQRAVCLPFLYSLYLLTVISFFVATSQYSIDLFVSSKISWVRRSASLIRSFRAYRQNPRLLSKTLVISLLFQFNIAVINKLYCSALDIDIAFGLLLVIIPLIYTTEMLPISINGIGVRDSAFVFFFVQLGYLAEEGLAVALLVFMMRYLAGLVGGFILLGSALRSSTVRMRTLGDSAPQRQPHDLSPRGQRK